MLSTLLVGSPQHVHDMLCGPFPAVDAHALLVGAEVWEPSCFCFSCFHYCYLLCPILSSELRMPMPTSRCNVWAGHPGAWLRALLRLLHPLHALMMARKKHGSSAASASTMPSFSSNMAGPQPVAIAIRSPPLSCDSRLSAKVGCTLSAISLSRAQGSRVGERASTAPARREALGGR